MKRPLRDAFDTHDKGRCDRSSGVAVRAGAVTAEADGSDDVHNLWLARMAAVCSAVGALPTSHDLYTNAEDDRWIRARRRQQRDLIDRIWEELGTAVPRDGNAIISGGMAGAGKTYVLKGPAGINLDEYLTINPDDIKEQMARQGMIPLVDGFSPMEASLRVHEEASELTKRLARRAYAYRTNVIWDITMNRRDTVHQRLDDLFDASYGVIEAVFVDTTPDEAIKRVVSRYRRGQEPFDRGEPDAIGGRAVLLAYMEESRTESGYNSTNRAVFEAVRHDFQSSVVYDNSGTEPEQLSCHGPRWE